MAVRGYQEEAAKRDIPHGILPQGPVEDLCARRVTLAGRLRDKAKHLRRQAEHLDRVADDLPELSAHANEALCDLIPWKLDY
jgi:hypothetical protein